jgi:hypothetical protein
MVAATSIIQMDKMRLTELETIVQRGIQTFIEVGEALEEIRDGSLWRLHSKYATWSDYLDQRWHFGSSRARQLINGARFARRIEDVTGVTLPNERVTREINSVIRQYPEEIQSLALEMAAKRGGMVTVDRVRDIAETLTEALNTGGYVTTADGEQNALESSINTNRKESEIAKQAQKLVDDEIKIHRIDKLYVIFKLTPNQIDKLMDRWAGKQRVRLVISDVKAAS